MTLLNVFFTSEIARDMRDKGAELVKLKTKVRERVKRMGTFAL